MISGGLVLNEIGVGSVLGGHHQLVYASSSMR